MDFAERLAALMDERGIGVRALARRTHYDHAHISRLRGGQRAPSPDVARDLDTALRADGELVALAADQASGLPSLAQIDVERLEHAVAAPRRADAVVAESLAVVLAGTRRLEDHTGSAAVLDSAAANAAVVASLAAEAAGPARAALVDVAGQWEQYNGWLLAATGRIDEGQARLSRALEYALEARDGNLVSEVLSFKGHLEWLAGHPGAMVGLSAAAQRGDGVYPGQAAISAAQEARGHAMLGDAATVDAKLDEADRLACEAASRPEERPPWLYYHSPGFFAVERGRAWMYLGAKNPAYNRRAIESMTFGFSGLDVTAQASEWGGDYLLFLAQAHIQAGDAEQACAVAAQAAAVARHLGSSVLIAKLRRLQARMATKWGALPCVAALGEALR